MATRNIALSVNAADKLKKISEMRKGSGSLIKTQVAIAEEIINKQYEKELRNAK